MSKQVILVVDENGIKDDEFEPIEIRDGESIDDAVERFLVEADVKGLGGWNTDTDGYLDTKFESSIEHIFEAEAERHLVSNATFFFKVVDVE